MDEYVTYTSTARNTPIHAVSVADGRCDIELAPSIRDNILNALRASGIIALVGRYDPAIRETHTVNLVGATNAEPDQEPVAMIVAMAPADEVQAALRNIGAWTQFLEQARRQEHSPEVAHSR